MKRFRCTFAIRAMLLVVIGFAINLAVAWTIAAVNPMRRTIVMQGISFAPGPVATWQTIVETRRGGVLVDSRAIATTNHWRPVYGTLPRWSMASQEPAAGDPANDVLVHEVAYGWPFVSMYSRQIKSRFGSHDEFALQLPRLSSVILPAGIVPTPCAVNTLIYSGIMCCLGIGASTIRRVYRVRTGRCRICGYPQGQGSRCSECGDLASAPRRNMRGISQTCEKDDSLSGEDARATIRPSVGDEVSSIVD